jgi:hypothetical protein
MNPDTIAFPTIAVDYDKSLADMIAARHFKSLSPPPCTSRPIESCIAITHKRS